MTYPAEIPAGARFYRDLAGDVMLSLPEGRDLAPGVPMHKAEPLADWVEANCPEGTDWTVLDSDAHGVLAVHLLFPEGLELATPDPDRPPAMPRVFNLVRYDDVSDVSGTGIVAQGVQARDGAVAIRWCVPTLPATWNLFDSIEDLLLLNGHNGRTVVKWADDAG